MFLLFQIRSTRIYYKYTKMMRSSILVHRSLSKFRYLHPYRRMSASMSLEPENQVTVTLSDGRPLTLTTGKLAKMTDGCAVAKMGDTSVMVAVVSRNKSRG